MSPIKCRVATAFLPGLFREILGVATGISGVIYCMGRINNLIRGRRHWMALSCSWWCRWWWLVDWEAGAPCWSLGGSSCGGGGQDAAAAAPPAAAAAAKTQRRRPRRGGGGGGADHLLAGARVVPGSAARPSLSARVAPVRVFKKPQSVSQDWLRLSSITIFHVAPYKAKAPSSVPQRVVFSSFFLLYLVVLLIGVSSLCVRVGATRKIHFSVVYWGLLFGFSFISFCRL